MIKSNVAERMVNMGHLVELFDTLGGRRAIYYDDSLTAGVSIARAMAYLSKYHSIKGLPKGWRIVAAASDPPGVSTQLSLFGDMEHSDAEPCLKPALTSKPEQDPPIACSFLQTGSSSECNDECGWTTCPHHPASKR